MWDHAIVPPTLGFCLQLNPLETSSKIPQQGCFHDDPKSSQIGNNDELSHPSNENFLFSLSPKNLALSPQLQSGFNFYEFGNLRHTISGIIWHLALVSGFFCLTSCFQEIYPHVSRLLMSVDPLHGFSTYSVPTYEVIDVRVLSTSYLLWIAAVYILYVVRNPQEKLSAIHCGTCQLDPAASCAGLTYKETPPLWLVEMSTWQVGLSQTHLLKAHPEVA